MSGMVGFSTWGEVGQTQGCPFKRGDVVRLKSGGPWMTVVEVNMQIGTAVVCWMSDKTDQLMQGQFLLDLLDAFGSAGTPN